METTELQSKVLNLEMKNEWLEENLNQLADRYSELSWDLIDDYDQSRGMSLDRLKQIEETLSDMAATNPLMKRAAQLRHSYVFGNGVHFNNLAARSVALMEDIENERALFTVQAYEELNLAKFTAGNFFMLYNKKTRKVTRVPLQEIDGYITDPESSERVWFFKRRWEVLDKDNNPKEHVRWYPLNTYKGAKRQRIQNTGGGFDPVDQDSVMFHETSNRQVGWPLGVPDALAAMSWAIAYSHYLNNNATLVKAYAQFAYTVTAQTKKGVTNTGAQVRRGGTGGTAVMGSGNQLQAMPATGSNVDFSNGQPLAAMVAASLGVSVIALLSSPGAGGGSYGAAATLDTPTLIGMKAIQDTWTLFYKSIFRHLRDHNATVSFPEIDKDPAYREVGAAATAFQAGALHQREFRDVAISRLSVEKPLKGMPKPGAFHKQNQGGGDDPVARQGNSGAFGSPVQGETNNDGRTDNIGGEK